MQDMGEKDKKIEKNMNAQCFICADQKTKTTNDKLF